MIIDYDKELAKSKILCEVLGRINDAFNDMDKVDAEDKSAILSICAWFVRKAYNRSSDYYLLQMSIATKIIELAKINKEIEEMRNPK